MDVLNAPIAVAALVLSLSSFAVSQIAARRTAKAEAIRALLGDRETVAFAALKLMQRGLPRQADDRNLTIEAIMQACVFVSSDRARALLYGSSRDTKPHAEPSSNTLLLSWRKRSIPWLCTDSTRTS